MHGSSCVPEHFCGNNIGNIYQNAHECIAKYPETSGDFALKQLHNNVYKCGTEYIDITGSKARRIDADTCGGLLSESRGLCIPESNCSLDQSMCVYVKEHSMCISVVECEQRGGHVYAATKRCEMLDPDEENGNFTTDDLKKHIYKCGGTLLDKTVPKARCVSANECRYGAPRGIIQLDQFCVRRDAWVNESNRNYVGLYLTALSYSTDLTGSESASIVCNFQGTMVDGVELRKGRICACPEGKYLPSSGTACSMLPALS